MKAREILIGVYIECKGNWNKMFKRISEKRSPSDETIKSEEFINMCESERVITFFDEDYPQSWKMIYKPPFVIVAK